MECHLLGWFPCLFCIKHRSPATNGFSGLRDFLKSTVFLVYRVRKASSFSLHASFHRPSIFEWEYFWRFPLNDSVSRRGCPNRIWAGDILQSASGVFLRVSIALRRLSLSNEPPLLTLDRSNRLADFTATSARPFDSGLYADDTRCFTSHLVRKSWVISAINSGPPSLESSIGTPNVANIFRRQRISPRAPAFDVPDGVENISDQPESLSPMTR